jgi:hypothetical protein
MTPTPFDLLICTRGGGAERKIAGWWGEPRFDYFITHARTNITDIISQPSTIVAYIITQPNTKIIAIIIEPTTLFTVLLNQTLQYLHHYSTGHQGVLVARWSSLQS